MKKKLLVYAGMPLIALALTGAGIASAHGFGFGINAATPQQMADGQTKMFEQQAILLGISLDDVKNAWAQGKSLESLALEKGITQEQLQTKMKELRKQQRQIELKAMVDSGVITQSQADQRLQFESTQTPRSIGKGPGFGM